MNDAPKTFPPRTPHKSESGFTLIELLVVISVIAVLMGILMPALQHAREQGKRAVCMNHLKQMMLAWIMYADENHDKIVCGDSGEYSGANEGDKTNPYWVWKDWNRSGEELTKEEKGEAIKAGALYPYCNNIKSYHCPTGSLSRTELRMYSIVDSMNVWPLGSDEVEGAKVMRIRQKIKDPTNRIVFMDDGGTGGFTWGGWSIHVNSWQWWDPVPMRHSKGTTFGFVDGHVDHWRWEDPRTLKLANYSDDQIMKKAWDRNAGQGNTDYLKLRYAVWGTKGKQ